MLDHSIQSSAMSFFSPSIPGLRAFLPAVHGQCVFLKTTVDVTFGVCVWRPHDAHRVPPGNKWQGATCGSVTI